RTFLPPFLPLVAVYLAWCLFEPARPQALKEVARFSEVALAAALASLAPRAAGLGLCAGILLGFASLFVVPYPDIEPGRDRFVGILFHPVVAGNFFLFSLFGALPLLVRSNTRLLAAAAIALGLGGIFLSGTRAAIVACLAGFLWIAWRLPGIRRRIESGVAAVLFLLLAALLAVPSLRARFDAPVRQRLEQWRIASWFNAGNRLLGTSPGSIRRYLEGRPPEIPAKALRLEANVRLDPGRKIQATVIPNTKPGWVTIRFPESGAEAPLCVLQNMPWATMHPFWIISRDIDGDGKEEVFLASHILIERSFGEIVAGGTAIGVHPIVIARLDFREGPPVGVSADSYEHLHSHLHNLSLQLAVETGLVGLLAFLLIPGIFLARWIRSGPPDMSHASESVLIAFLCQSLVGIGIYHGLAILLGVSLGIREPAEPAPPTDTRDPPAAA
ncbi:MAG: hypothetical protein AAB215_04420, partial [Planctomycetota bacterium]